MTSKIIPVILSGGSGTRLWPLSRGKKPKQFLNLLNDHSMLQNTLLRLKGLDGVEAPIIICNDDHRFMVAEQLREINIDDSVIMLEPSGRNTAPAIAAAALKAISEGDDPLLLVLAADHQIRDVSAFQKAVSDALKAGENGWLVTFGIVPDSPQTGYGYIKQSDQAMKEFSGNIFKVDEFKEKPDLETAAKYLDQGGYCWNSGMFLFKASTIVSELEKRVPDILKYTRDSLLNAEVDLDFVRLQKEAFSACPSNSIDYAVMENSDKAVVIPLDAGWNDVGSWDSLWEVTHKDARKNALMGDVVISECSECYINAEERLVVAIGLKGVIVVETKDALLIANKGHLQDVKTVVNHLQKDNRQEVEFHREVFRPWGKYDSVDNGERYQVKHITVKPGARLSVQKHMHRAEHWVVVSGEALVRNGDRQFKVGENESTFIPVGVLHSLENPGDNPLELIEVQSGSYLGEDDIVRFEDIYGRA